MSDFAFYRCDACRHVAKWPIRTRDMGCPHSSGGRACDGTQCRLPEADQGVLAAAWLLGGWRALYEVLGP